MQQLMATLNMPSPCHKTVKKKEREVGVALESLAKESCLEATIAEKSAVGRKRKAEEQIPEVDDEDYSPSAQGLASTATKLTTPSMQPITQSHASQGTVDHSMSVHACYICGESVTLTLRQCKRCPHKKFHHTCGVDETGKLCIECMQPTSKQVSHEPLPKCYLCGKSVPFCVNFGEF